ncbi:54S ribosomal protein L4 [Penicillium taxi]|uniref:54S ribosomal protein L4 n=1 Tax=Penicillium taxi TaxID=168475 RepID=UPI002544F942|nr:54S ribosomal protein L4 [Penicillium taxi]KAJ5907627.1 54S ribosomal protein L4 [Penicillium taxi]
MHRPSLTRLAQYGGLALAELPPPYLAPSLHFSIARSTQIASFSTSPVAAGRDMNRTRGVSAIHRTGPRFKLTVSKYPLPKPVSPEKAQPRPQTPNHGLWAFFPPTHEALGNPETDMNFGRPWGIQELRGKSWDDLQKLWWVCCKERNRIASTNMERDRLKIGYGEHEAGLRDDAIRSTQSSIKHVLRERWYAWEEAERLFKKGARPSSFVEEFVEESESK